MKRMLSVVVALVMVVLMTPAAFAKAGDPGVPTGVSDFGGLEVNPGDTVEVDTDWFYGKWTVREDGERVTYEEPVGNLTKDYHTVAATWTKGEQYIENVYFEEDDGYVSIDIKGGISTVSDIEISGTIKIIEKDYPNRPNVTYTCKIQRGDLLIHGIDEKSRMVSYGDKEFGLPYDYQEKQVRFSTEDGEDYGTFIGEFTSERGGGDVAEFRVKIIDQKALYLGFSESTNSKLAKKYPDADLRFINWTARPTFEREGKLSIYMYSDEYIYGVNDDNSLYRLGGTYDEEDQAYVITTKTLGSYVISDTALTASGSGSGGNTSTVTSSSTAPKPSSSSVAPPPSSSVAPPPSSSVAPPPSSSVAPPPSSSAAPPPSSSVAPPPSSSSEEESSEPDEESSEPEDDDEDDRDKDKDRDDEDEDKDDDDEDDEDEDKEKKKGFPLIPVLLGVLGVVIIVCAVVVVGNRNSGSRSRSRRRRYDDDWDD